MDLVLAHVLDILDDLLLLKLAVLAEVLLQVHLGHTYVLLLQSVVPRVLHRPRVRPVTIVVLNAIAARRNDLNFDLVGLREAKAFREEAAPLLRRSLLIALHRFVLAIGCAHFYSIRKQK